MANSTTAPTTTTRKHWAYRFFRGLTGHGVAATPDNPTPQSTPKADASKVRGMTRQLVADDRYVFVLLNETAPDIAAEDAKPAWTALTAGAALVPAGKVPVVLSNGTQALLEIPGFYLDRYQVSNRQFQRFVDSGGYDNLEIWPQEVWPSLMKFCDRTRRPGPRFWENGKFAAGKADHPVVGVCWYEASAYAAWVGKRLPAAAEWQKAGGWPEQTSGGSCHRYPWGNIFEPARANLWSSGLGEPLPVNDRPEGATPNGIYQMTGNVWEWLYDPLDAIPCGHGESFHPARPMRRVVGGAFDTYFPGEATCQFITGQPELDRRENIGFRCALTATRLRPRL